MEKPKHPLEKWLADNKDVKRFHLAERVGVHPSRITQIASGERPSPDLAFKLEAETGIDARIFLNIQKQEAAA